MKFPNNLGNDIVIFNNNNIVDVFFGTDGWEPHARFIKRKTNKGVFLNQTSGSKVPPNVFSHILQKVS